MFSKINTFGYFFGLVFIPFFSTSRLKQLADIRRSEYIKNGGFYDWRES